MGGNSSRMSSSSYQQVGPDILSALRAQAKDEYKKHNPKRYGEIKGFIKELERLGDDFKAKLSRISDFIGLEHLDIMVVWERDWIIRNGINTLTSDQTLACYNSPNKPDFNDLMDFFRDDSQYLMFRELTSSKAIACYNLPHGPSFNQLSSNGLTVNQVRVLISDEYRKKYKASGDFDAIIMKMKGTSPESLAEDTAPVTPEAKLQNDGVHGGPAMKEDVVAI